MRARQRAVRGRTRVRACTRVRARACSCEEFDKVCKEQGISSFPSIVLYRRARWYDRCVCSEREKSAGGLRPFGSACVRSCASVLARVRMHVK